MTCKLIILSVECLYITYIIISWSFQREFWLTCFSVYMAKTLLLIVKCLHILILYPVLNQSSYLIAKSLMLPMLGRQALFVFGVSSCHSVVGPILIWWLYKDNQIIHLTFDTSDLSSKFRLHILVKWFILNTLYGTCVFFIYSFQKDMINHRVILHVVLGWLSTLEFNELQREQYLGQKHLKKVYLLLGIISLPNPFYN